MNLKITTKDDLRLAAAVLKALPKKRLSGPAHPLGCLRQELFGRPNPVTLGAGSDHFGVLDTYTTGGNC